MNGAGPSFLLDLPDTWHRVELTDGDSGDGVELLAVRVMPEQAAPGYRPNLAVVVHSEPLAYPVSRLADRTLGRRIAGAERSAVFTADRRGTAETTSILRGVRLLLPEQGPDSPERELLEFQLHVGLPAEPGAAEHRIVQLVLACEADQRPLVDREFEDIVNSLRVAGTPVTPEQPRNREQSRNPEQERKDPDE